MRIRFENQISNQRLIWSVEKSFCIEVDILVAQGEWFFCVKVKSIVGSLDMCSIFVSDLSHMNDSEYYILHMMAFKYTHNQQKKICEKESETEMNCKLTSISRWKVISASEMWNQKCGNEIFEFGTMYAHNLTTLNFHITQSWY